MKPRDDDIDRCPDCGAWRYHEHCTTLRKKSRHLTHRK